MIDPAAIAARRRDLFGAPAEPAAAASDVARVAHRHCGICPLPPHLICHLACAAERANLTAADGIKVY
jgi:hypothetical protein